MNRPGLANGGEDQIMINEIKKDADRRMAKSVVALTEAFRKLRTGRAQTGLLEHLTVAYLMKKRKAA